MKELGRSSYVAIMCITYLLVSGGMFGHEAAQAEVKEAGGARDFERALQIVCSRDRSAGSPGVERALI